MKNGFPIAFQVIEMEAPVSNSHGTCVPFISILSTRDGSNPIRLMLAFFVVWLDTWWSGGLSDSAMRKFFARRLPRWFLYQAFLLATRSVRPSRRETSTSAILDLRNVWQSPRWFPYLAFLLVTGSVRPSRRETSTAEPCS